MAAPRFWAAVFSNDHLFLHFVYTAKQRTIFIEKKIAVGQFFQRRLAMALALPRIPIAVASMDILRKFGTVIEIPSVRPANACAFHGPDAGERCVWVVATYSNYRGAWNKAAEDGAVDKLADWGRGFDVDHLFPRSWAEKNGIETWLLRLHPVYREVNRSAGGGREKACPAINPPSSGVIYAKGLQVMKLLGHPVGTTSAPEILF